MVNQAEIIDSICTELSIAYLAAGRNTPRESLDIVAASLAEAIPFSSREQVHECFKRAKDVDPIPTQKTLKEAFRNHAEETLKYEQKASDSMAIEYRDPRSAWLPKSLVGKKVNLANAIKNYCEAIGEDMSMQYMRIHHIKKERRWDKVVNVWENPDAVEAFDAPIKDYLRYLYTRYIRSTPAYAGFPADAKLNLGLKPPTTEEFRTMLKAEGQI